MQQQQLPQRSTRMPSLCLGEGAVRSGDAGDINDFNLPAGQQELAKGLAATNLWCWCWSKAGASHQRN